MMLELHNVTIGSLIQDLSLTVNDGQLVCLAGDDGVGKTTLLRAVMGFIPIDGGHISIDGELLTPQSAPYFRRQMAYVPQQLSLPVPVPMSSTRSPPCAQAPSSTPSVPTFMAHWS